MKFYVIYVTRNKGETKLYPPCCVKIDAANVDNADHNFSRLFTECFGDSITFDIVAIIPGGSGAVLQVDPYRGVTV